MDVYFCFSRARFARALADVFEKNEKKNKTTSVYRLLGNLGNKLTRIQHQM